MSTENKTATEVSMRNPAARLEYWMSLTPQEMRRELFERQFDHCLGSSVPVIVRNVQAQADKLGLSGEDRYTVMAYTLARALEQAQRMLYDQLVMMPPAGIVADPARGAEVKA